jgi:hypothetical protein
MPIIKYVILILVFGLLSSLLCLLADGSEHLFANFRVDKNKQNMLGNNVKARIQTWNVEIHNFFKL